MQNSIYQLKAKKYLSSIEEHSFAWNGLPGIFAKMDWFSGVFKNVSVEDVFSILEIDKYDTVDFRDMFTRRYEVNHSGIPEVVLNLNGVMVEFRLYSMLMELKVTDLSESDVYDIFSTPLEYVRLNISGSGLDYLRSIGLDVDLKFREEFILPAEASFHPTRVDCAFDLINYHYDFVDKCKELCRRVQDPRTFRVPAESKGGVKWSERGGDQNTIYLGSTGSDKLLRIYDKKMQYIQANKFVSNCPYKNGDQLPDSWIRFELQSRRPQECSFVLYDCQSYLEVFKYIYNKFAIRELKYVCPSQRQPGEVSQIWQELFDWNKVRGLIQNTYFVQYKHPLDRAKDYVLGSAKTSLWFLRSVMGWENVGRMLDEEFLRMQTSGLPSDQRTLRRLDNLFMSIDFELPDFVEKDDNGIYRFTDAAPSIYDLLLGSPEQGTLLFRKISKCISDCRKSNVDFISIDDLQQFLLNYGIDG